MATMVTVLLKQKKYRLDAHSVESCEPAVCFHLDTDEDYLTMHFESPGEMVRFGEQIVGDGLRLMNTTTLAEALADPQGFVEGMTETLAIHPKIPDNLKPKRKPIWDRFDAGETPASLATVWITYQQLQEYELEHTRWKLAGGTVKMEEVPRMTEDEFNAAHQLGRGGM